MPPKFNFAHVTQLNTVVFTDATPPEAVFEVENTEYLIQIQAHAPGVYRIRCGVSSDLEPLKPRARDQVHAEMLLARPDPVGEILVSSTLDAPTPTWRLSQGDLSLEIKNTPFQMALYQGDTCVLRTLEQQTLGNVESDGQLCWRFAFNLNPDEIIHGLGDSQGALNKRGQFVRSDKVNQRALPLAWSNAGWGVYVNFAGRVEHDAAASQENTYQIGVYNAPVFDLFLFVGDPYEIINQYTALTGRPGQPGLNNMGVWLDQVQGESTAQTIELVNSLREQGFALDGIHLAAPTPFGFQSDRSNIEWDAERVPEPRELFGMLEEQHIPLMAPTIPAVLQGTLLFEQLEDRGWLLIKDDGYAYVQEGNEFSGGTPFGLLDLTNKDVYRLWSERIRQLVDEGLAALSCSAQYDLPDDITARGGESGALLRTLYPAIVRNAIFDAVAGHKTPQEGVVCSSDTFPAAQRFSWQIGPEVSNDWQGMERSLRSALSMGDSGIVMQSHKFGNANESTEKVTPELYIRWLAMCVFSGNFHIQGVPQLLPTAFDKATQELAQHWLQWRYRLVPYVIGIIEDSVRTGMPVQRSMAQAFPLDTVAHEWDTQYMFGPSLLIAPVFKPGTTTQIYLPEGSAWWDLSTGWRYEGGTVWTVEAPLNTLPVFGREGHILSLGPAALYTGDFNSARILDEVWMFGMPEQSPVVMRNRIRVMQMQGSSYIKGLEGLKILPSEGLEVKRRGAEVRISRAR